MLLSFSKVLRIVKYSFTEKKKTSLREQLLRENLRQCILPHTGEVGG